MTKKIRLEYMKIRLEYMNNNMTIDKRITIKNYIFKKYTGQEVLDCLSVEYPESYKYYYELNVKKSGRDTTKVSLTKR